MNAASSCEVCVSRVPRTREHGGKVSVCAGLLRVLVRQTWRAGLQIRGRTDPLRRGSLHTPSFLSCYSGTCVPVCVSLVVSLLPKRLLFLNTRLRCLVFRLINSSGRLFICGDGTNAAGICAKEEEKKTKRADFGVPTWAIHKKYLK